MPKVAIRTLDNITNNSEAATLNINNNFKALQEAIENTVSRDGTVPNYMEAALDMNSNRIINAADPVDDNDLITKKYFDENVGEALGAEERINAYLSLALEAAQKSQTFSATAVAASSNADEKADEASQSAAAALVSEQNAKASELAAASSKQAASNSADAAYVSEQNAKTSETIASDSRTAASQSASSAASSASSALSSKASAESSASAAEQSATNAQNSANAAAQSATNSQNSANAAAASAAEVAGAVIVNTNVSGTFNLEENKNYHLRIKGGTTFVPPVYTQLPPTPLIVYQIFLDLSIDTVVAINWGTDVLFVNGEAPDVSTIGTYMVYYQWCYGVNKWLVGAYKVGA